MGNNQRIFLKLNARIYRCTQAFMDKKLEKYNITTGIYPYLLALSRKPGINQSQISREINVDKSMSTRAVKKLMQLEYIKKIEDSEDTRAYKLYLTEKGEEIIPYITKAIKEWIEILLDGASYEEIAITQRILSKALENGESYKEKFL